MSTFVHQLMHPILPSTDQVAPWLLRMDASAQYSNHGPLVRELERSYALRLGVSPDCIVALASATVGLTAAVAVSGIQSWLVPDFTFAATGLGVLAAGKQVVIADVDRDTWQLSPALAAAAEPGVGIMPVMAFGSTFQLLQWPSARSVVVDAAASLGSLPQGLDRLPDNWAVVFSLHATKVLGAGEGGLVVCGSAEFAAELRRFTNFGFDSNRSSVAPGINGKMPEVSAAYALASLSKLDSEMSEWRILHEYSTAVAAEVGISPPPHVGGAASPYWIAEFEHRAARDAVWHALEDQGVQCRPWWPVPLSGMPAFSGGKKCENTQVSEDLAGRHLGLPMHRRMRAEDFREIGGRLAEASGQAAQKA